jgi:hypothetical protein
VKGLGVVAALAIAVAATLSDSAHGEDPLPPPLNLRTVGGADTWRIERSYVLAWDDPKVAGPPIVAVHYRVRNAQGAVVRERRIDWAPDLEDTLPDAPGVYTAEVWLEDASGRQGPPDTTKIRFDNVRPAQVEPIQISRWLGRAAFPYTLRVNYPQSAIPVSGLDGFAVVLDSVANSSPCAAKDRCSAIETNLGAGLGGGMFPLAGLPEGSTHIHVVAVSGSGMKSVLPRHAVFQVDLTDPVTRLAGNPAEWTNKPVALTATTSDGRSGMEAGDQSTSPFTALQIDGGLPKTELGASVSAMVITEGIHSVAYYARDAAGNVNDGNAGNGQANGQPQMATVRIDRSAPSVAFANHQDHTDPELIRVQVRDALSGPQRRRGWIGIRQAGTGDGYQKLATEPTPDGFGARWDSDEYQAGEYEFRAIGYDTAGNASPTALRADGSRMVLSNPLKELSSLLAGFGGRELARRQCVRESGARRCRRTPTTRSERLPEGLVVSFGREISLRGRLSAGPGAPLTGMEVRIVERFSNGASASERVTTATTGEDGVFTTRLPPGPSRDVTAVFEGTHTLTRSVTRSVRLGVRSDVSLRASSSVAKVGGQPLIFQGKVAANHADFPAGGKAVQLQFRLPGLPWAEFRTIQTDRRGRFRYAYRFTDDDSRGVRFRFRAYVPAQGNWPYEPSSSEPVAVWGR